MEKALTDENTKKIVHDIINTGKEFNPTSNKYRYGIRSTPTMILNERMVIGTSPKVQLRAIFKALLYKEGERVSDKEKSQEFIKDWR